MSRATEAKLMSLTGLLCLGLTGCTATPNTGPAAKAQPRTYSSFDVVSGRTGPKEFEPGALNFQNTDLLQVLAVYQEISGRTVIRPATLPAPTISVRNQTPLSRVQALQLLDTVLAQNGIAMVLVGETAVKAVPEARAASESPPEITLAWEALPDSGSFMMRRVQLKTLRPSEVVPLLQPLAKAPNSILPLDARKELVLRDYSSNIRRMLQLLQDLEKSPAR
jgi:general secretion pathway protein D